MEHVNEMNILDMYEQIEIGLEEIANSNANARRKAEELARQPKFGLLL